MALLIGVNSFITVAGADVYFMDSLLGGSWSPLSADQKSRGLVTAAQQINLLLTTDCKLPKAEVDINASVATANAELALAFILDPSLVVASSTGKNIKKVSAAPGTSVEFFRATSGSRFPPQVMNILRESGCIGSAAVSYSSAEAFGLCDKSSFSNPDLYSTGKGFA